MRLRVVLAAVALAASPAVGQTTAADPHPAAASAPAVSPEQERSDRWSFSAAAYTFLVPDDRDYLQPVVAADRSWLHLEARYNYEASDTGSLWAGYSFAGGTTLAWELRPMIGAVLGDTSGVAPGYEGSLSWRALELYSEGEYLFDTRDSSASFFYNWSELTLAPAEWLRIGVVTQRTRAYRTDRDLQRGLLAGLSYRGVTFTTYVFNPDESRPTVVFALAASF